MPKTKLAMLKEAAAIGSWRTALQIAAKFPRLGEHRETITRAWAAIQNPQFYRDIGEEPDVLVSTGIEALKERYSL